MSFLSVLLSGMTYSVNAASLVGVILFTFFLARYQKVTGIGGICALLLLTTFFAVRFVLHLGLMNAAYAHFPAGVFAIYMIRMILALCLIVLGAGLFFKLRQNSEAAIRFLKDVYLAHLKQKKCFSLVRRCFKAIKAFFWGIFFGIIFGVWPLNDTMTNLMYDVDSKNIANFFNKMFFFDMISFTPFFVVLFFMMRGIKVENFGRKMIHSRLMLIIYSGVFIAIGCGAFLAHIKLLVN